jgi:hypothetical protein
MKRIMINTIDLRVLDEYENVISNLDENTKKKIEKYKSYILKSLDEDYKYGSSWLDLFILEKKLKCLEKTLRKFGITDCLYL